MEITIEAPSSHNIASRRLQIAPDGSKVIPRWPTWGFPTMKPMPEAAFTNFVTLCLRPWGLGVLEPL